MKLPSFRPANKELIAEVDVFSQIDVQKKVELARRVFEEWSKLNFSEREKYLLKLKEIIVNEKKDIAELISGESGKPITEAISLEILPVLNNLTYLIKNSARILKEKKINSYQLILLRKRSFIVFEPLGIIGIITPACYPFINSVNIIATALIAGNTVIFKPSEYSPLVGLKIGELFQKAGLPDGVLNIIFGGSDVRKWLVESDIDKIFFIGSSDAGRQIMETAAKKLHPLCLELGGKDAFIVLADADLELAANAAVWGAFANSGKACFSVERVYVAREIGDEFIKLAIDKTKKLVVGEGLSSDTDIGPLTNEYLLKRLETHIQDAILKGASLLYGGRPVHNRGGFFFLPAILTKVNHSMKVMNEETFGPILPIMEVKDVEEAINLANDSKYGLSASIWTKDVEKGKRLAGKLKVGTVWVNDIQFTSPEAPWGGIKDSGFGKINSKFGLMEMVNIKHISLDQSGKKKKEHWFPYNKKSIDYHNFLIDLLFGKGFFKKFKLFWRLIKIKRLISQSPISK